MKKTFLTIVLLFSVLCSLFSSNQRIFYVDSKEYQAAYALCISAGVLPPSSVNPLTGEEIISALNRIPAELLNTEERAILDNLLGTLEWKPIINSKYLGIDPLAIISLDGFVQTDVPSHSKDFFVKYKDRLHAVDISLDFDFANVGYGFVDYLFLSPTLTDDYSKYWGTNLDSLFNGATLLQLDGVFNAGLLFGNEWMNFSIMSTRQSMGYGRTGNLG